MALIFTETHIVCLNDYTCCYYKVGLHFQLLHDVEHPAFLAIQTIIQFNFEKFASSKSAGLYTRAAAAYTPYKGIHQPAGKAGQEGECLGQPQDRVRRRHWWNHQNKLAEGGNL